MNRALFRAMLKQYRKKVVAFSTGIFLYEGLLTWVYPVIAENPAVTEVAEAMPTTVKTVFGIPENSRIDTFEAYISGQFFARIWVMIMALYGIQTANELLAKMVDDGSLAFLLSTPVPRSEILSTQTGVLISTNTILVAVTIVGLLLGTRCSGIDLKYSHCLRLGFLGVSFFTMIDMYSLYFSARFVEEERALTYATGLTLAFYALDIVGGLSDRLSGLKRLSIFQWFQPQEVLEGTTDPKKTMIGLSIISAVLWFLAKKVFETQDLAI